MTQQKKSRSDSYITQPEHLHSAIGYVSPIEYELTFAARRMTAKSNCP